MTEQLILLDEPELEFGEGQTTLDPHDGLSLFGCFGSAGSDRSTHVVIGTEVGLTLWNGWRERMNRPAACKDHARLRAWPCLSGDSKWLSGVRGLAQQEHTQLTLIVWI